MSKYKNKPRPAFDWQFLGWIVANALLMSTVLWIACGLLGGPLGWYTYKIIAPCCVLFIGVRVLTAYCVQCTEVQRWKRANNQQR